MFRTVGTVRFESRPPQSSPWFGFDQIVNVTIWSPGNEAGRYCEPACIFCDPIREWQLRTLRAINAHRKIS